MVLSSLREGQNRKTAAERAGISYRTLQHWFAWGQGTNSVRPEPAGGDVAPYERFVQEAKKAEKESVAELVARIRAAGGTNWTANAWLLERMIPEDFADNRKLLAETKFALEQAQKLIADQQRELDRLGGNRADDSRDVAPVPVIDRPRARESESGAIGSNSDSGSDNPAIR